MEYIKLKGGASIPRLGMGTWYLGNTLMRREEEIHAIQTGIENGMTLIDTAEMYGNGQAEQLVGQAIRNLNRENLFLVSKVLPQNARIGRIHTSVNNSLRLLRTDYLDLYLLHWRGSTPLEEVIECMEELVIEGKIRAWGVSNFDTDDMEELFSLPKGEKCAVNQVLYHVGSRGIEYSLKPWLDSHDIPLMAYCPLAQGGMLHEELINNPILNKIASEHDISVMQLLLAFVLSQRNTIAIPRSGNSKHVKENAKVYEVKLTKKELQEINCEFPVPDRKCPLDIV